MRSQRLDLTDNERAVLITALRRLVDFNPQPLSPQIQALKAILERLEPQKPQPIPDTASTGWGSFQWPPAASLPRCCRLR
jgi:hypothetical protein